MGCATRHCRLVQTPLGLVEHQRRGASGVELDPAEALSPSGAELPVVELASVDAYRPALLELVPRAVGVPIQQTELLGPTCADTVRRRTRWTDLEHPTRCCDADDHSGPLRT